MKKLSRMTLKVFVFTNLVYALLVPAATLIVPHLHLSPGSVSFFKGVATGIAVVWLLFVIFGIRETRKPSYVFDERFKSIILKSGLASFVFSLLAVDLFLILAHLDMIPFCVDVKAIGYYMLSMLAFFILSFGYFCKKG